MSDLQYGDTFQLQGLGYQPSITLPPAGGYLTFDATGKAVTTVSPSATWKLESPDGKQGGYVMVGDTVRIVGVSPKSVAGKELQCVRESNAQAHAGNDPKDLSLTWIIYAVANAAIPGGATTQAIPTVNSFLCFSSSLAGTPVAVAGADATGEFLCIENISAAQDIQDGLYMVHTRPPLNANLGGDTWWKLVAVQQNSAPLPTLTTGQKCCFNVPDHALLTVAYVNKETSAKTIKVSITGQMPVDILVPADHSTGSRNLVAGPGTPQNQICIEVENAQSASMLLGWTAPALKDGRYSIQIYAETPPNTGLDDIVVTVSWQAS